jgi:thiamine monophosphate kinase
VDERTALHKALYDGEDFELLFAAGSSGNAAEFREEFRSRFDCGITLIGEAVPGSRGVSIVKEETEEPLREAGFSHFD